MDDISKEIDDRQVNDRSKDIETQSIVEEFLRYMNDENRKKLPMRLNSAFKKLRKSDSQVLYKHSEGGRVIYLGAGDSGRVRTQANARHHCVSRKW